MMHGQKTSKCQQCYFQLNNSQDFNLEGYGIGLFSNGTLPVEVSCKFIEVLNFEKRGKEKKRCQNIRCPYGHSISFSKKVKKWIFVVDIQFVVVYSGNSTVLLNSHVSSKSSVMLSSAVKFPAVKSNKREMLHQPKLI